MVEDYPENENFDHMEVVRNIFSSSQRLRKIIEHKEKTGFSEIDLEISAIMHQLTYFSVLIQMFHPLETTFERMKMNPTNPNDEETIKSQVLAIDFNSRKSFLVLIAFSFETLLYVIAEKHRIELNHGDPIVTNYLKVMDFFEIEHGQYENVLKIFHYTRNSLHSGTKIKKAWGPFAYQGEEYAVTVGQGYVKHTSWNYFTYFTHEITEIFEKIYQSPKFDN